MQPTLVGTIKRFSLHSPNHEYKSLHLQKDIEPLYNIYKVKGVAH